jgi:hypothetical protein
MSGGGSSAPGTQNVQTTTSNLPDYARPYFENLMRRAESNLGREYVRFEQPRIAGFTPAQQQVQQNVLGMQAPNQFATGSALALQAGRQALEQRYDPSQFSSQYITQPNLQQFSMGAPTGVFGRDFNTPQMQTAQTGFHPNLQTFQMKGPETFGVNQAQQYMSPFLEQALEPQLRSAVSDARRAQITQDLGAARQGTYGGSRQLLASLEREKDLSRQMGDIRARGMQSAFENAQQQFERDRAAGMTTGQANLQAALQQQQLGTQTGLQAALANLDAASQANVQNLAATLQTQGLNADQALRAALANQQAELTTGQQNLSAALQTQQLGAQTGLEALRANQQADLERQRLSEQSRQFGAQQGLAGLQAAGQMGQTLGNLGQSQQQANLQRLQAQAATAGEQRALEQQGLDLAYQDFLRQRDYQMEMLGQYSNLLRGLPMQLNTTQTTYGPLPSMASQVLGTGLGALGVANTFRG